jgi:hypothetical protein
MTKAKAQVNIAVNSPALTGKKVAELTALAKSEPAKLAEIRAHGADKLARLIAKGCTNERKLDAWASIADGRMTGWVNPKAAKVAPKPKASASNPFEGMTKAQVSALSTDQIVALVKANKAA